jgi:hypothetical protein
MSSSTRPSNKNDADREDTGNQQTKVYCGRCAGKETGPYAGMNGLARHTGIVHGDVTPIPVEGDDCCRGRTDTIPSGRDYCIDCGRVLESMEGE